MCEINSLYLDDGELYCLHLSKLWNRTNGKELTNLLENLDYHLIFRPTSTPCSIGMWSSCSSTSQQSIRRPTTNLIRCEWIRNSVLIEFQYFYADVWMFQVVLWDKIILRGENAMLDYRRYFKHPESLWHGPSISWRNLAAWTRNITSGTMGMGWWATRTSPWPSPGTSFQMLEISPGLSIKYLC